MLRYLPLRLLRHPAYHAIATHDAGLVQAAVMRRMGERPANLLHAA